MTAPEISPHAIILSDEVDETVTIGPFAVIEKGAKLGRNCKVHSHVTIGAGVALGDEVVVFSGAVIGKAPAAPNPLHRGLSYEKKVEIGDGSHIGAQSVVYYGVEIGARVLIGDGAVIREENRIERDVVIGQNCVLARNNQIGEASRIGNSAVLGGDVETGKRVFVASSVTIANSHNFGSGQEAGIKWSGVRLDDDCRIGIGACILPGVSIGSLSTVAAGAVVTESVPAESTVFGVPAKLRKG